MEVSPSVAPVVDDDEREPTEAMWDRDRSPGPDSREPDLAVVLTDAAFHTPDPIAVFSGAGYVANWWNVAFQEQYFGAHAGPVRLLEMLDEWSQARYAVKVLPVLVERGSWRGRLGLIRAGDRPLEVDVTVVARRALSGGIDAVTLFPRVSADPQIPASTLVDVDAQVAALIEHASDIIAVMDERGVIGFASPAMAQALGYPPDGLVGVEFLSLVDDGCRPGALGELARADAGVLTPCVSLDVRATDGGFRRFETVVTDLRSNSAVRGYVLNARDVTEWLRSLEALSELAATDAVTGLPNRVWLLDRLAELPHERPGADSVALFLIDLDHFRAVNEGHGTKVGDLVLSEIGRRLVEDAGPSASVARLRSDEFAVLLTDVHDSTVATRAADALRASVARTVDADSTHVNLTATVGVAAAQEAWAPEELLRRADRAAAAGKAAGGNQTVVYGDDLASEELRRCGGVRHLRRALEGHEVEVFYQPIVDLRSDTVVAAEALVRIRDEAGTLVMPSEFLAAAQSSGLIDDLGKVVLAETCAQLHRWAVGLAVDAPDHVSLNIATEQLTDPTFAVHLVEELAASAIEPRRFWLEITARTLDADRAVVASLRYLRDLGLRIGVDEFGARHGNLNALCRFPLDFVKLDRDLVAAMSTTPQQATVARATIEVAHELGLDVVAVGIETDRQLERALELGCDLGQGYLFAPPVPPGAFPGFH